MDPRSEVILRQIDYLKGSLLLVGLPADSLIQQLKSCGLDHVRGWSWYMDEFYQLNQHFPDQCIFSTEPPEKTFEQAIIFLPKSKELTEYLIHRTAAKLSPNGLLFLVGEKRAGIERAAKQLEPYGKTMKLDSARHCQLWLCSLTAPIQDKPLPEWANHYPIQVTPSTKINIVSLPGVFSHGRLDKGTALLLQHVDHLPHGDILDFGCGSGVIGTYLKQQHPDRTIHFLDIDAFALAATRLTLSANGIKEDDSTHLIAGRGIQDAPKSLAAIISNPPFHQGVHTNYHATESMLKQASAHLRPMGELRIVANSFLQYPPLIDKFIGPCARLANNHGFTVYQAKK